MFKQIIALLLTVAATFAAPASGGIKISEYPRATTLGDNDLFVIAYYGGASYTTNKGVKFTNIVDQILGLVPATLGYNYNANQFSIVTSTNVNIKDGVLLTNAVINGTTDSSLTASRGVLTDSNKRLVSSTATAAEINQLAGVTVVPSTRTVTAGVGLSGGGALSGNIILNVTTNSTQQKHWIAAGVTNLGVFDRLTLWPGANITLSTTNGAGNTNVDIVITATSGGSGTVGSMISNGSGFSVGSIPKATDTTGTNFTGSGVSITGTNLSVPGTIFANDGVFTNGITIGAGGTNISIPGIFQGYGLVATNGATIGSSSGIATLTSGVVGVSTTITTSGTNAAIVGNLTANSATFTNALHFKMTDYKDFIYPHKVDGTGCVIITNNITLGTNAFAAYAGTGGTNANYAWFRIGTVPYDLDTSVTMTLKGLGIIVNGSDTGSASFSICYYSPASSAAGSPADFTSGAGYVTTTTGTLTSPAQGDQFYLSDITLTGWASGLTAGRPFIIGIARDGGDANNDIQFITGGTIAYGRTQ